MIYLIEIQSRAVIGGSIQSLFDHEKWSIDQFNYSLISESDQMINSITVGIKLITFLQIQYVRGKNHEKGPKNGVLPAVFFSRSTAVIYLISRLDWNHSISDLND